MVENPAIMRRRLLAPLLVTLLATPVRAELLDDLGPAIRGGHVVLELALRPGAVPVAPAWSLVVVGSPVGTAVLDANDGKVSGLHLAVDGGELILVGKGLRPDVVLQSVDADASGVVTAARFHGRGAGRPIVALFRGLAMRSIRKLRFHTGIAELLRGDLLAKERSAAPAAASAVPAASTPPPAATPAPAAGAAPPAPGFMDLIEEVRVDGSHLTAFAGRRLAFGKVLGFEIGEGAEPLRLDVDSLRFRPARAGSAATGAAGVPATYRVRGGLAGRLAKGELAWGPDLLSFASGELAGGRFELDSEGTASVTASLLTLRLSQGRFRAPVGVTVDLADGSSFAARDLSWSGGKLSALVDLDVSGKTGSFARQGSRLTLQDARLRCQGLRIDANRASGSVDLEFDYTLLYPLSVKYPMPGLEERHVDLEFRGPFTARIDLEDVGGDDGKASGVYRFKAPWAPVEKAAFEVLRARWQQDVPGVKKVAFQLEPERFVPCGGDCFLARFRIRVEKEVTKTRRLTLDCVPEGSASLVVDKESRTFLLKGVKIRPQCKGLLGKAVDLIAPLVTKSYEDLVLFKLPEDAPFAIDAVTSGEDWIEVSGRLAWEAAPTAAPAAR